MHISPHSVARGSPMSIYLLLLIDAVLQLRLSPMAFRFRVSLSIRVLTAEVHSVVFAVMVATGLTSALIPSATRLWSTAWTRG